MPLINTKIPSIPFSSLLLFAALILSGCAGKPWTSPLDGDQFTTASQLVDSLLQEQQACGPGLDGDLALFYTDPLEKQALSGYLQFSSPGSYKFVVANPFGQTLVAIAGDQKWYQYVNVPERKYLAGSMQAFGVRHSLPNEFLNGQWGEWITGRNLRPSNTISAIYEDKDARGLWISFRHGKTEPAGMSHLLLEPSSKLPLARVLENSNGKIIAKVTYGDWITLGECHQPLEIHIEGLDYGTDIRLKLSNVQLTNEGKQFSIPVPPGYTQQLFP
ncbi:MAG: hypothetical protein OEL83_20025 [Desulforhopalus sp.]|nr:hypothetical protein [Desulforhopalus sp.]